MINPHFDHNRVIWKDEYSGNYQPVDYGSQFDHEWRLFLEQRAGFHHHTGVETEDLWINDRIFDLTGVKNYLAVPAAREALEVDREVGGRQHLDLKFGIDHFRGKRCLDAACGAGRWTRTLQTLGASVKSIDISEHGLKSVRRFNDDAERLDLFELPNRPDLHAAFDFTICWGVVMCTHDPKLAFENVARTVRSGGSCYVMVYAPTYHNSPEVLAWRKHYHKNLKTFEEKLVYAYSIADRPENAINYLDMLHTYYNWVVEEETIHNWFRANGFFEVITLNASEENPSSYHVFGRKRMFDPPLRDDLGNILPRKASFDPTRTILLKRPFRRESGHGWLALLGEFAALADNSDHPSRSQLILLEDGQPLWTRHTLHDEIRLHGRGRYSHWGNSLMFSTSDNSDPNSNNRRYEIVFGDSPR
jgi:SAM-dependent methyltransferase